MINRNDNGKLRSGIGSGLLGVVSAVMLSACAYLTPVEQNTSQGGSQPASQLTLLERPRQSNGEQSFYPEVLPARKQQLSLPETKSRIVRGTGNFINQQAAKKTPLRQNTDGEVTLNFELADIRDVIKVIFDTLQENYILDPRIQGEVTIQTTRPLAKEMLIPTLETLLRSNGATLLREGAVYRVLPVTDAVRGGIAPRLNTAQFGPGYSVRIFPLKYISVTEMQTILQPFAPEGGILLADPVRILMILAGTSQELNYIQETIDIFDVNWLKGMSVGMYTLQNVDSQDMAAEMDRLFGPNSGLPLGGLFRFVPINRLNALLVITPQAEFLNDVGAWIERLDGSGGERLYVYEVQFSEAEYLASLLNQIFEGNVTTSEVSSTSSGRVAPNRAATQASAPGSSASRNRNNATNANNNSESANFLQPGGVSVMQLNERRENISGSAPPPINLGSPGGGGSGFADSGVGVGAIGDEIRVIADSENNSLMIWANAQNYGKIVNSLNKIDVPRRQVLIEAMIAEVTLTDDLEYGLQWFFQNRVGGQRSGTGSLGIGNDSVSLSDLTGFSYTLTNTNDFVRAVLSALANDSKLKVLSAPQLMVMDNETATINVGDQEPIVTSNTVTDAGNDIQNFQFRDTGVILEVSPKINAGGLVTLDINQEVTDLGPARTIGNGQTQSSFTQRRINSKVAIQSGQTLVLGGLITDRNSEGQTGIPGLYKVPIIGPLFGNTQRDFQRTELVVLITPRVVNNSQEAAKITEEIKETMRGVVPLESPWKRSITAPRRLLQ